MWDKLLITLSVFLGASLAFSGVSGGEFDDRTKANLVGVDDRLHQIVYDVYHTCPQSFVVIDGLRTLDEQKEHLESGATTTLNSKHLTGHAIDFYIGNWDDIAAFTTVGECFKQYEGIEWGGDWKNFKDYGHVQLIR